MTPQAVESDIEQLERKIRNEKTCLQTNQELLSFSDSLQEASTRDRIARNKKNIKKYESQLAEIQVTETTRQVVEVGTDGVEKRDITRIILLSLLILMLIVFVYINKTKCGMSVEEIMASVASATGSSTIYR